jgi:hypothetical protein
MPIASVTLGPEAVPAMAVAADVAMAVAADVAMAVAADVAMAGGEERAKSDLACMGR